ncbi:MAG: nucleotidyltransferase domain-containing protein [Desulfobacterales bacterium]|nr:nucleotidyltransferase domain-containing protein [Desulfobacterales bacterium]
MKLYMDWKGMNQKDNSIINKVKQTICSLVPDADIVLYGSRAREDAKFSSDWDFLILVNQPLTQKMVVNIRSCLYDLELQNDTDLSSIIRTKGEWNSPKYAILPFKQEVDEEGILL